MQANKRAGKKNVAAKSAEANAEQTPAAPAGKADVKQTGKATDTVDLLTTVDLIKKSSANRAKQKQNAQQQQQPATESAAAEATKTAPGGKKVATRGRNANLQVVEVEPKQAKRGKRKAASESAEELAAGNAADSPDAPDQPEEDAFLPNKKRSKQHRDSAPQSSADAGVPDLSPSQVDKSALRDVPGLPGVKHQMPKLAAGNTAKDRKQTEANSAKKGRQIEAGATAAVSASHSQSGPTRSNNSKRQASSGKPAAAKTAKAAQPEAIPSAVQSEVKAAGAVDKPADRNVDVAMQPTLASAGAPQGMQFHRLQVPMQSVMLVNNCFVLSELCVE